MLQCFYHSDIWGLKMGRVWVVGVGGLGEVCSGQGGLECRRGAGCDGMCKGGVEEAISLVQLLGFGCSIMVLGPKEN